MAEEHYLKEAPYRVMDAGRTSWGTLCVCGWRSKLYDTEEELMAVVKQHMENPGKPPKKKPWWKREAYDYEDRRNR